MITPETVAGRGREKAVSPVTPLAQMVRNILLNTQQVLLFMFKIKKFNSDLKNGIKT